MRSSQGLDSLLPSLGAGLEAGARELGLQMELAAPSAALHLSEQAAAALREGVEAALAALPRRASHRDGEGRLGLTLAPLSRAAPRLLLRVLWEDDRPGLAARQQPAFFAGLESEPPSLPADDLLGLGPLLRILAPLSERPDFFSGALGTLLWWDLPLDTRGLDAAALGEASSAVPGWLRRPRLDRADLLRRLGGNAAIAAQVIAVFREDAPQQLNALREARELKDLHRLCHGLKGAAQNVGGQMLAEVARAGEREASRGRQDRVAAILPRLEWEWAQLEAAWVG